MTIQKTRNVSLTSTTQADGAPDADDSGAGGAGGTLLEQARAFAQVAREAMRDCERGAAAVDELHRRRNQSGQ